MYARFRLVYTTLRLRCLDLWDSDPRSFSSLFERPVWRDFAAALTASVRRRRNRDMRPDLWDPWDIGGIRGNIVPNAWELSGVVHRVSGHGGVGIMASAVATGTCG